MIRYSIRYSLESMVVIDCYATFTQALNSFIKMYNADEVKYNGNNVLKVALEGHSSSTGEMVIQIVKDRKGIRDTSSLRFLARDLSDFHIEERS